MNLYDFLCVDYDSNINIKMRVNERYITYNLKNDKKILKINSVMSVLETFKVTKIDGRDVYVKSDFLTMLDALYVLKHLCNNDPHYLDTINVPVVGLKPAKIKVRDILSAVDKESAVHFYIGNSEYLGTDIKNYNWTIEKIFLSGSSGPEIFLKGR